MYTAEIEVYSDETNRAVVRVPNRRFPGVVVQGDSLSVLYRLAKSIFRRAKHSDDAILKDDSERLYRALDSFIRHYERVLHAHDIQIPYHPDVNLQDALEGPESEWT